MLCRRTLEQKTYVELNMSSVCELIAGDTIGSQICGDSRVGISLSIYGAILTQGASCLQIEYITLSSIIH